MDRSGVSVLSTDTGTYADSTQRVLRNTYALLSVTLLFSAVVAWAVISMGLPRMNFIVMLVGYFGILFAVNRLQNSAWGVLAVFGLTGWLGYTMGGILEMYLRLPQGSSLIMQALGLTGLTFVGLSAFVVTTKRDFGFMGAGCIHPGQVTIVNEEYTPTTEEVEYARKIIKLDKEAAAAGRGSWSLDGKMIDIPIIVRAQKLIKRYDAIKARESKTLAAAKG